MPSTPNNGRASGKRARKNRFLGKFQKCLIGLGLRIATAVLSFEYLRWVVAGSTPRAERGPAGGGGRGAPTQVALTGVRPAVFLVAFPPPVGSSHTRTR